MICSRCHKTWEYGHNCDYGRGSRQAMNDKSNNAGERMQYAYCIKCREVIFAGNQRLAVQAAKNHEKGAEHTAGDVIVGYFPGKIQFSLD